MFSHAHRLPLPAFAIALFATFAFAGPAQAAACAGADAMPGTVPAETANAATLCLLNNERAAQGLVALKSQPVLETPALSYSKQMVDQHFFAHVSPAGQVLEQRLSPYIKGSVAWDIGENLAWGEGSRATPAGIVDAWMHSTGHRANILNGAYREIGIGIVNGSPSGSAVAVSATYTTEFGSRVTQAGGSTSRAATVPASSTTKSAVVSAATKHRIRTQCAKAARKVRSTAKARKASAARCVTRRLRAARR